MGGLATSVQFPEGGRGAVRKRLGGNGKKTPQLRDKKKFGGDDFKTEGMLWWRRNEGVSYLPCARIPL